MENKIQFGRWETTALLSNLMCMQIFLTFPRLMAEDAATAAWIQTLYISILALIGFAVIARLYRSVEGMDIVDVGEYIGGSFGRIATGLVYISYSIFAEVLILRAFSENMKTIAVPRSPLSFISLFFVISVIVGAYQGIEAIVRMHALNVPIIITGLAIILLADWRFYSVDNIIPLLGTGTREIFLNGAPRVSVFAGLSSILFFSPYFAGHKNFTRSGFSALLIAGLLFTLSSLCYGLMYPYPASIRNFLPIYEMAREIQFGRFIQRGEAIFVFIWATAGMLYLSASFFSILLMLRKAFKLEYYKPLVVPLVVVVFTLSFLPQSLMSVMDIEARFFRNYLWITTFALPILLLSIAAAKKHRQKEMRKCQN